MLREIELRRLKPAKLFISAQNDSSGVTSSLEQVFRLVPRPKELHIYPRRTEHGTHLFETNLRRDLLRRISSFLARYAPPLQ
jgi:hypothetical protein